MEGEEDVVAVWESAEGFDLVPARLIACPLADRQLLAAYSMPRAAQVAGISTQQWDAQLAAQQQSMLEPKLSKKRRLDKPAATMRPLSPNTVRNRQETQQLFVGFCVTFLSQEPSLALALQPQLAAKYFGFLLARGRLQQRKPQRTRNSITHHCNMLIATVHFVLSDEWQWQQWGQPYCPVDLQRVLDWYANVRNQASVINYAVRVPGTLLPSNMTYHMAISFTTGKWDEFVAAFKVGRSCRRRRCPAAAPPPPALRPAHPSAPSFPACRPGAVSGARGWPSSAWRLGSCACSWAQPSLRCAWGRCGC